MRHALLLTLLTAAALSASTAAQEPSFLNRLMGDWINDLSDKDPEVRRGAAFALGKIGAEGDSVQVVSKLTAALGDGDAAVRDFAASGLGDVLMGLGKPGRDYWAQTGPALRTALKDEQPRVRRSAAYALGAFGPDAVPARDDLIAAAGDPSPIVRQNAAWALGRLGQEAGADGVSQIRNLLKDDEPLVRRDALHALGEVGNPTAHPAVQAMLQTAASEKDGVVRKAAVEALAHLVGKEDREYAGELYPLLKDKDSETRYNAAFVLGIIGGKEAVEALPTLMEALKDQDPHFQELAAAALQNIGPDAAPAAKSLGDALMASKEPKVRAQRRPGPGPHRAGRGRDVAPVAPVHAGDRSPRREVRRQHPPLRRRGPGQLPHARHRAGHPRGAQDRSVRPQPGDAPALPLGAF